MPVVLFKSTHAPLAVLAMGAVREWAFTGAVKLRRAFPASPWPALRRSVRSGGASPPTPPAGALMANGRTVTATIGARWPSREGSLDRERPPGGGVSV